ncbi:DHS-like NAD/FAD-binding domain-containing protein [Lipomyces oligophaga]|uniref:DHS-like NAD/FAD-binding domain-containing protein n=1 Tax=Lipomyces oligophaga TaxID=45792 RepID=UPI0034CF796E
MTSAPFVLECQPAVRSLRLLDSSNSPSTSRLIDAIALKVSKARRIIIVTGAGISCNAGIPDFRSENGLYNMVKKEYPDAVVKGKDLFDSVLFSDPLSASVFCTFMARLRACILEAHSTSVHKFIKLLHDKRKLLRCYTQNIDGLESQEDLSIGVEGKRASVVQLHGDIHILKCTLCNQKFEWTEEDSQLLEDGLFPECPKCFKNAEVRASLGKRSPSIGGLRPNIVLYGEEHPDGDVIGRSITADIKAKPDMLIIAGTSLKVMGIKKLVRCAAKSVHEAGGVVVYINQSPVTATAWNGVIDYHIEADCDAWVEDLRTRNSKLFLRQTKVDVSSDSNSKMSKPSSNIGGPYTPKKPKRKYDVDSVVLKDISKSCGGVRTSERSGLSTPKRQKITETVKEFAKPKLSHALVATNLESCTRPSPVTEIIVAQL